MIRRLHLDGRQSLKVFLNASYPIWPLFTFADIQKMSWNLLGMFCNMDLFWRQWLLMNIGETNQTAGWKKFQIYQEDLRCAKLNFSDWGHELRHLKVWTLTIFILRGLLFQRWCYKSVQLAVPCFYMHASKFSTTLVVVEFHTPKVSKFLWFIYFLIIINLRAIFKRSLEIQLGLEKKLYNIIKLGGKKSTFS